MGRLLTDWPARAKRIVCGADRQGDEETRRQGDRANLLVSFSPCLLVIRRARGFAFTLGLALLLLSFSAHAEEAKYDLRELSLWGLDPTLQQANELAHYPSAMPGVVDTDRSRANEAHKLTPLSIITLHGEPLADLEIDLRVQSGRFVGHWPPAETKSGRLRWLDLTGVEKTNPLALFATVDEKHWFVEARRIDGLYVQDKSRAERFLTYDCELKYELPVQVTGGPDRYQISNSGKHAILDLFVIVPEGDGVRVGRLESLPPSKAARQEDKGTRGQGDKETAAAPAPSAGSLEPTELTMSPVLPREADELKAVGETIAGGLLKLGFTRLEIDLLIGRAANTWLEAKKMVVLFRLPVEAIEERLPLVAYPAPRKTLRAALVVVDNIDPKIKLEVQNLIAQLGAAEYTDRESAEKRLTELGRLAVPALRAALKSADLEVVFRAERILLAQNEKLEGT